MKNIIIKRYSINTIGTKYKAMFCLYYNYFLIQPIFQNCYQFIKYIIVDHGL